ncbi:carbohydrate ABC transporter permease [Paenibacillus piri]|uniref:Carbohydrate ABC transporter permease n=1 Tax=Paenibacillus piri TaxID=2547395 RepID=A0A4R5KJ31_9BACL|nr:carbohydrate ABC transporter permease [Paenibacillus piri]TDF95503.1 carbohydrate ABC transporter permease [Paenibacillus piri]
MRTVYRIPFYAILWGMVLATLFPFIYMILGSFKENFEILSLNPSLWPRNGIHFHKYAALIDDWPFIRNMLNSLFVSISITILAAFLCLLAGYTFAKYHFPAKNVLYVLMLATMMIPFETRLIPTYLMIRVFGWSNSYQGLILPMLQASLPFGIFMIRQFAVTSVPNELMEAARIEGATETQILGKIAFPILTPALVSLVVLTFMNSWNDFLWPLIAVTKKEMFTVSVALKSIADPSASLEYGIVLAAATLSVLPILIMYLFVNKMMIKGMLEGSGKEG